MAKKKKASSRASSESTLSDVPPFEQSLQALQQLIGQLESGQLTLDESLSKYEQGVQQLRNCHLALEQAEKRIRLLVDVDADGRAVTDDFGHQASWQSSKKSIGDDDEDLDEDEADDFADDEDDYDDP